MPDITEVIPEKQDGEFVRFPDSPFELFQPYPPAGDQPEAINKLVEGLRDGEAFQTLLGVTGSGKTFTMANVIARMGRPAIVFAPNKTLAAQLYSEFREFFPKNAVEYFVSYYDYYQPEAYVPRTDTYIEKDSSINEQIDRMRHSAARAILERDDVIVVASVSCIYGIGSVETYTAMTFTLKVGDVIDEAKLRAFTAKMDALRARMAGAESYAQVGTNEEVQRTRARLEASRLAVDAAKAQYAALERVGVDLEIGVLGPRAIFG